MTEMETRIEELEHEFWGTLSDMTDDLEEIGLEVLDSNSEMIVVSYNDDGDYVQLQINLGGTETTIYIQEVKEIYREEE